MTSSYAALAQLDRVFGYEPKGQGFESLTPRQNTGIMLAWFPYFVLVFVREIPRKCLHLPERAQKPHIGLQPYSARLGSDPLRRAKKHCRKGYVFCSQATDKPHHIKGDYQFAQNKEAPLCRKAGASAVNLPTAKFTAVAKRLRDCFLLNLCVLQSLRLVPRHLPLHKGGLVNSQFVHFDNSIFENILCQ